MSEIQWDKTRGGTIGRLVTGCSINTVGNGYDSAFVNDMNHKEGSRI